MNVIFCPFLYNGFLDNDCSQHLAALSSVFKASLQQFAMVYGTASIELLLKSYFVHRV